MSTTPPSTPPSTPAGAPAATPRRATITDVAREAGTGKTSISRYLNGEIGALSPELRARIEAAIARLDYQPNQMARGLKRGRNRLIGMLVADLTNPYSVEVLQGVEAACHALGLMPLICHAANEVEMERRYLQLLTTYRVEGVIVNALGVREETLRPVGDGGIPAVLVDRRVEGLVADMVGLDNDGAAELGARHLLDQGFEQIWFVVQPFEQVSSRQLRVQAFERAMRDAGGVRARTLVLDLADDVAVERALAGLDRAIDAAGGEGDGVGGSDGGGGDGDNVPGSDNGRDSGRGGNAPRVALFAANAPVALRVALHLKARYGARWQERAALLSIDDPDWAELAGITTIRQPTYEIGYRAVEFLHERIEGAQTGARDCLLAGELIVRASTVR
ncbi:LacI family DNA-binding transcriptional regulator [Paraburkholderia sp. MMS20-SJTR3]|uniref:LacI family DNA-binding transcriptional regulator n=1 Tax=Paraburkholderia sejongensis TaxID=2886946 RepID=A0ABS8JNW8_9BURK|nr:LacI family DNA-binding transcriptional regulator [Paraburkholderia sp. MMS20-SJTR3]MCC8391604.1 LacI family DNA-binding transcriptional regulator [Paraburkholderia sp. MMS20-SJTR3]